MEDQLKELTAIYSDIASAFRTKDLDGVEKYIGTDWTGSYGRETVTRAQLLESVRGQFQNFDEISWRRSISNARLDDNNVIVRAEGTFRAVKKDNREPIQMEFANDDTWLKGQDGWQNIYSNGLDA